MTKPETKSKPEIKRVFSYEAVLDPRKPPVRISSMDDPSWALCEAKKHALHGVIVVEDVAENGERKTVACLHRELGQAKAAMETFLTTGVYYE